MIGLRFEPTRTIVQVYPLYVKNRDPRVDYVPRLLRGGSARHYLQRIAAQSGVHGKRINIEDFRGSMELPWAARETKSLSMQRYETL